MLDMIARLTGKLVYKSPQQVIMDVGGVGYSANVSLNTFSTLPAEGSELILLVHTYVREDALILFGFTSEDEKQMFARLIGVSGVGPKLAIAILSGLPPSHLASAIIGEDRERLNAIPGVGKKTAERIIIDLKDKLSKEQALSLQPLQNTLKAEAYNDALSALTNLGYTRQAAESALKKIKWCEELKLEEAIRFALKELVPQ